LKPFKRKFLNDINNNYKMNSINKSESTINKSKIFRFKLSDEIMLLITQFAKMHQYDDRHAYKEAWEDWSNIQQDVLEREVSRLEQIGYKGDVLDKMFKAGRYYFREKKQIIEVGANEVGANEVGKKTTDKNKRSYIVMNPKVILAMDQHLKNAMKQADFKPAKDFVRFCEQNLEMLRREITSLKEQDIEGDQIAAKIKKTYKNRYFNLSKAC
jgi:hypothetical protein